MALPESQLDCLASSPWCWHRQPFLVSSPKLQSKVTLSPNPKCPFLPLCPQFLFTEPLHCRVESVSQRHGSEVPWPWQPSKTPGAPQRMPTTVWVCLCRGQTALHAGLAGSPHTPSTLARTNKLPHLATEHAWLECWQFSQEPSRGNHHAEGGNISPPLEVYCERWSLNGASVCVWSGREVLDDKLRFKYTRQETSNSNGTGPTRLPKSLRHATGDTTGKALPFH